MIESPYENDIYTTRLIVLLEAEPLLNQYQQMILTQEQFKQVSDLLWGFWEKEHKDILSETAVATLPEDIKSFY